MVRSAEAPPVLSFERMETIVKHRWPAVHDALLAAGWRYVGAGSGHHKYRPPPGRPDWPPQLMMPVSPSDHRAERNVRAQLRRLGVSVGG